MKESEALGVTWCWAGGAHRTNPAEVAMGRTWEPWGHPDRVLLQRDGLWAGGGTACSSLGFVKLGTWASSRAQAEWQETGERTVQSGLSWLPL